MAKFRRSVLIPALTLVAGPLAACVPPPPPPPSQPAPTPVVPSAPGARPNVVMVLTDDQTLHQMVALQSVRTRIASEGTTFTQAVVSLPLCCPARATLLTGQYPQNHGVIGNSQPYGYLGLDQTNTIAAWLHDAGYRTGHVGKYMNGYGSSRRRPLGWDEWWAASENLFDMYDYELNHNGTAVRYGSAPSDYKSDVFTEKALEFLRASTGDAHPFYLQVWYTSPHVEQTRTAGGSTSTPPRPAPRHDGAFSTATLPQDPNFNETDLSDKPSWVQDLRVLGPSRISNMTTKWRSQLESLLAVDEGVDRMLDQLESAGQLDNTIVVFSSDNGNMHGEHRMAYGKDSPYETSINVPLMVRGPGFPRGAVSDAMIGMPDVTATILDAAGAAPGLVQDGVPLTDAIGGVSPHDRPVPIRASVDIASRQRFRGVRTARWAYWRLTASGEEELYDLRADPWQLDNLAGRPALADIQRQLVALMDVVQSCRGDGCRIPTPAALR